jgi:hypothetical protein
MVLDFLKHQIAYIDRIGNIEKTEITIPSNDKLGRMFGLGAKSVAILLAENFTPEQLAARKKILDQQVNVDRKIPLPVINNVIEIVTDQLDAISRGEVEVSDIYSSKEILAMLSNRFPEVKISTSSIVNIINKMLSEEALEFRRDLISDNKERKFVERSRGQIDPLVKEKMIALVKDQLERISTGEIGAGDVSTNIELGETFGIYRATVRNVLRATLSAEELSQRAVLIEEKRVSRGVEIDGEYYGSGDEAAVNIIMRNYLGYDLTRSKNYQITREIMENGKRKWIIVDFMIDNQGKRYYIDYHPAHLELMDDLIDGKNPYQRAKELYPSDLAARKKFLRDRGKELMEGYKEMRGPFIPENSEYSVLSDAGEFYDLLKNQATLEPLPSQKEFIDLFNAMTREFRKNILPEMEEDLTG